MTTAAGAGGVSPLIAAVLGVFSLVVIGATAVAYFRAAYAKATIETLKGSNDAYAERITQLEHTTGECQARMSALEQENVNLRSYVAGTDAITALAETLKVQHGQLMDRIAAVLDERRPPRKATARKATARKAASR